MYYVRHSIASKIDRSFFRVMIDCFTLVADDIQYNIHMASKKHVLVMKKRKRKLQDAAPHGNSDGENTLNSRKKS